MSTTSVYVCENPPRCTIPPPYLLNAVRSFYPGRGGTDGKDASIVGCIMSRVAGRKKKVSSLMVAMMLMFSCGLLVLVASSSPGKNNRVASSSDYATVKETIGHALLPKNAYSLDRFQDDLQKQQQQRNLGTRGDILGDGVPPAAANSHGLLAKVSDSRPATAEADERKHKDFLPLDR